MLFSRWKPQFLGALGALMFGAHSAEAITLNLGDTGEENPVTEHSSHFSVGTTIYAQ